MEDKSKKYMSRAEIIERLTVYIQENDFGPGDKLPPERKICQLWDVNRSTLRSALHRLVEDGYLEAEHGKGYYIRKSKFVRNLQDMKSIKITAEEQGRDIVTRVIRQEVISGDRKLADIFKIGIDDPILELVRMRYIDGEAASLEYNYTDLTRCKGLEKVDFSEIPYYTVIELRYDLIPNSGHQDISLTSLREEEAVLFGKSQGSPAIYMQGVTYDKKDKEIPIEVFKSISDAKIYSFASHMKVIKKEEQI